MNLIETKLHKLKVNDKFVFEPTMTDFPFTVTKVKNMLIHYKPDFSGSGNHTRFLPEMSNETVYLIQPHEHKTKKDS